MGLIDSLVWTIGIIFSVRLALLLSKTLFQILVPEKDLIRRYGQKTWALVTGATGGIGHGFVF